MSSELDTNQVVEFHDTLSNWNRWGPNDAVGTLNYITEEKRRDAAALIRTGRTVSCARVISPGTSRNPQSSLLCFRDDKFALEHLGFVYHGPAITHLDSLCHIFHDGHMYNGYPLETVGLMGASKSDVTHVRHGIITRGVLIDIPRLRGVEELEPGDPIHSDELNAVEAKFGLEVGEGDVVFVRTGMTRAWNDERTPINPESFAGCHADCLPWFYERRISLLGSDGINDVVPSGFTDPVAQPIHWVGIVSIGLHLIDNGDFEELSAACADEGRWEFFLTIAALPVAGGTGSPVNPIAIF